MPTIADSFRAIVTEQFGVPGSQITNETSFVDDLGAESLDMVELTMRCEEVYGIQISDDEAEKIETFGSGLQLLETKDAEVRG